jgi:hypothetical protein
MAIVVVVVGGGTVPPVGGAVEDGVDFCEVAGPGEHAAKTAAHARPPNTARIVQR